MEILRVMVLLKILTTVYIVWSVSEVFFVFYHLAMCCHLQSLVGILFCRCNQ